MTLKRLATALVLTAALALAPAASAEAAKLKKGIYDCMRYDYYSGFSIFTSTFKLKDDGKYQHAFGRKDAKLSDPSKGTYTIDGNKIKFRKGGMAKTRGKIKREDGDKHAYVAILFEGEESGIDCYYVPKP